MDYVFIDHPCKIIVFYVPDRSVAFFAVEEAVGRY